MRKKGNINRFGSKTANSKTFLDVYNYEKFGMWEASVTVAQRRGNSNRCDTLSKNIFNCPGMHIQDMYVLRNQGNDEGELVNGIRDRKPEHRSKVSGSLDGAR